MAQSLSQASFDAWIKFYKPSANSVNAHVSYYRQGALAAWVLDAEIRRKTKSKKSLDDVLRLLWEDFKAAGADYSGITSDDVPEIVARATELDLTGLIADLTETAMPVDYAKFLKPLGVTLEESETPAERKLLGISGLGNDAALRYVRFMTKKRHSGRYCPRRCDHRARRRAGQRRQPSRTARPLRRRRRNSDSRLPRRRITCLGRSSGQAQDIPEQSGHQAHKLGKDWLS